MAGEQVIGIRKADAPTMVAEIARKMQIPIEADCQKSFMNLKAPYGKGTIMSYHTSKGLDSIVLNCTLTAPLTLELQGNFSQPIFMYTSALGKLEVTSEKGTFTVDALQAVIHGAYGSGQYSIRLPAVEPLTCMITLTHRKLFFKEIECSVLKVPIDFLEVIKGNDIGDQEFLFTDIYHLPAVDAVHDIVNHVDIGLLHSAHASAKIYENMFLLLNEYKRIHASKNRRLIRDAVKINMIRNAEKILVSRLQDPPTIPVLAKMIGMNQQTLKTGFRQLFGSTINNYVNNQRLEQAGILINGGEMSIAEIANAVGYSNGGYFSRKFKQKYGVTPSKFA